MLFPAQTDQRFQNQLFCTDIDAARGFGDKQEFGVQHQGSGHTHLLLIAAG